MQQENRNLFGSPECSVQVCFTITLLQFVLLYIDMCRRTKNSKLIFIQEVSENYSSFGTDDRAELAKVITRIEEENTKLVQNNLKVTENLANVNKELVVLKEAHAKLQKEYKLFKCTNQETQKHLLKKNVVLRRQILSFDNIKRDDQLVNFYIGSPNAQALIALADFLSQMPKI